MEIIRILLEQGETHHKRLDDPESHRDEQQEKLDPNLETKTSKQDRKQKK